MSKPDRSVIGRGPAEAELAAFADGSLPLHRQRAVAEQIAASPRLQALVAEQRAALRSIRALDVTAPPSVVSAARRATRPQTLARRRRARRWTVRLAAPIAATAAAATAGVIAVLAASGGTSGPSVAQAAVLGGLPGTAPAPAADRVRPQLLQQSVERIPFPDWSARFHLSAVGQRADQLGTQQAKTVFYSGPSGGQIGYTIVAGRALALGHPAATLVQAGTRFRVMRVDGRSVVTWQRGGHTCILSSSSSSSGTGQLVALAASTVRGAGWYQAPSAT